MIRSKQPISHYIWIFEGDFQMKSVKAYFQIISLYYYCRFHPFKERTYNG